MSLTPYQREILQFVQGKGQATTDDLVERFGGRNPYAPRKYVTLAVGRMVNTNLLKRVKPGVFEVGTGTKSKPSTIPEWQTNLFEQ